jgi:hypothetical protein
MEKPRVFEDFPTVDCNECENYWTNSCDGANTGSQRLCKTFKAVRRVSIPEEVNVLKTRLKWLCRLCLVSGAISIGCLACWLTWIIGV